MEWLDSSGGGGDPGVCVSLGMAEVPPMYCIRQHVELRGRLCLAEHIWMSRETWERVGHGFGAWSTFLVDGNVIAFRLTS